MSTEERFRNPSLPWPRWWWEGWSYPAVPKRGDQPARPAFAALGLVTEGGGIRPPDNPGSACTVNVGDAASWIAYREGVPR